MLFRRRRGAGFFPGLIVGAVLGVGASAALGAQLYDSALWVHQEGERWRVSIIEGSTDAFNKAQVFLAQTESVIEAEVSGFADSITPGGKPADTTSRSLNRSVGRTD